MEEQKSSVQLFTEQINPIIINTYLFSEGMNYKKGERLPKRIVKSYELEFFLESKGGMYINDTWYDVKPGDVVFRRPYEYTQAIMPYSCYAIYFDINNSLEKKECLVDSCSKSSQIAPQENYDNLIINAIPSIFHPIYPESYHRLFEGILKDFIQPLEVYKLSSKIKTLQILFDIFNEVKNPLYTLDQVPYGKLIKKTINYIHDNICKPILLEDLANMVNLSPNYYHVIFKNTMNITPHEYIIETRMRKAKELLVFTNNSVYEISDECGFINSAYFSYYFKKKFNASPTSYRKQYRLEI